LCGINTRCPTYAGDPCPEACFADLLIQYDKVKRSQAGQFIIIAEDTPRVGMVCSGIFSVAKAKWAYKQILLLKAISYACLPNPAKRTYLFYYEDESWSSFGTFPSDWFCWLEFFLREHKSLIQTIP